MVLTSVNTINLHCGRRQPALLRAEIHGTLVFGG
jgi:hypothetical protein